ncbi:cytochrome c [Celeribacter marinus]|uniref:c-type cytochrome n=1 Tax=Celeribacter marinus TaxID=1397108 RepID=UPI0031769B7D
MKHTLCVLSIFVAAIHFSAPAFAVDAQNGQKLAKKCSACHGKDGISKDPEVPSLAGQPALYLRKAMEDFQNGSREDRRMTMMAKPLSKDDIGDLAAWFSAIKVTVELPTF